MNATEIIEGNSDALDGPIALHYHVPVLDGSGHVVDRHDFLIDDIFALGGPVSVVPMSAGIGEPASGPPGGVPSATRLAGVYPNPFNPTTTVSFDLAVAENVRLEIYDARGALIRTLVEGFQGAGRHERRWDGRDNRGSQVGSGVYLVRFVAGSYQTSQKVVMLK